jgi:protein tyrosine phosphatase (PTP) superfamily phosphohydrolase (DUF442 family)
MSQIDDLIWVGSCSDASNTEFMDERGIEYIICCAEEYNYPPGFLIIQQRADQWYRVALNDNVVDELTEGHFRDAASKLNEWVSQGKKVLVHCREGKSRSVSAVIAYYMIYHNWSFDIAYWHLKVRRPMTNPWHEYVPILRAIGAKEPHVLLDR